MDRKVDSAQHCSINKTLPRVNICNSLIKLNYPVHACTCLACVGPDPWKTFTHLVGLGYYEFEAPPVCNLASPVRRVLDRSRDFPWNQQHAPCFKNLCRLRIMSLQTDSFEIVQDCWFWNTRSAQRLLGRSLKVPSLLLFLPSKVPFER